MKIESARDRVVRNFARLSIEDLLPHEDRLAIVEEAILEEVTIREMLHETVNLEAGLIDPEFTMDESEKDLVSISCPS
jgi:hypothetical protein